MSDRRLSSIWSVDPGKIFIGAESESPGKAIQRLDVNQYDFKNLFLKSGFRAGGEEAAAEIPNELFSVGF